MEDSNAIGLLAVNRRANASLRSRMALNHVSDALKSRRREVCAKSEPSRVTVNGQTFARGNRDSQESMTLFHMVH